LASINLLKFLRDDDTFDVERFRQITELIITAMDISICFADFRPRRYRLLLGLIGNSASGTPTSARC